MLNYEVSEYIIPRNTLYTIIFTKVLMVNFTIFRFIFFTIIILYYEIFIYIYIYIYKYFIDMIYMNIYI